MVVACVGVAATASLKMAAIRAVPHTPAGQPVFGGDLDLNFRARHGERGAVPPRLIEKVAG